jgi:hypothetical protein
MADLLGEVDVNIPSRPDLKMKPIKSESRRKTRIISPPRETKPPRASIEGHSNGVSESKRRVVGRVDAESGGGRCSLRGMRTRSQLVGLAPAQEGIILSTTP